MEEIQGADACSFNPPPTLQDLWSCVLLMFPECNHACKRGSLTKLDQQYLQCNDRAMISQICNVKPEDVATIRSNKLLVQLEILRENGFAGLSMLNDSVAQLRQFVTCR